MEKQTITATEFKAKCLDLLDQVERGDVEELEVTKRGRVVARVVAARPTKAEGLGWHGLMKGTLVIPDDLDLTLPMTEIFDDVRWEALEDDADR